MASLNHWYSYHLIKMETTTIRVGSNSRVKSCNKVLFACSRNTADCTGCPVDNICCTDYKKARSKARGDLPDGCTDEDIEDDYARKAGLSAEARSDSKERSSECKELTDSICKHLASVIEKFRHPCIRYRFGLFDGKAEYCIKYCRSPNCKLYTG